MGSLVSILALSLRNGCLVLVEGEEVIWQTIDSAPPALSESVDLFGWVDYDMIEMRLTDCEIIGGDWHYFCAGEMLNVDTIGFHPTHWMPLPEDPK